MNRFSSITERISGSSIDEMREISRQISEWAHKTGETSAHIQGGISRWMRRGVPLEEAVARTYKNREREYQRNLGDELFEQMREEGKLPWTKYVRGSSMNESKIANRIVMAAAGPYTLLQQLKKDLNLDLLDNEDYLQLIGHGWGHTRGADYIFGKAGEDIVHALLDFAAGRKSKEYVIREIDRKIDIALRDNEPFRGLDAEDRDTHDRWMLMMKQQRAASTMTAGKAIELVERQGSMFETEPKYVIMFKGKPFGELYFNMRGYVAERGIPIPSNTAPDGIGHLDIGERSLSQYKSEINKANREWSMRGASVKTAMRSLSDWKTEARSDGRLKDILDRAWEMGAERETVQALNDGTIRGIHITDSDLAARLKDYTESWHNRLGSDKAIGVKTAGSVRRLSAPEREEVEKQWEEVRRGKYRQGLWKSGMSVKWNNQKWFVWDLQADVSAPDGLTLTLISPNLSVMVDNARTDEVEFRGIASVKTASVQEGDVCTVDITARGLYPQDVFGRNQFKILRDIVRQGDGYVDVDEVSGGNAMVSAHGNVGSKLMGGVSVPVSALRKVSGITAAEKTRLSLVRSPDTNEWIVKVYIDGKYSEDKTYHTDDKQDAIDTMKHMKKELGITAAESNHKDFDNKKDALKFLNQNALMSVGWKEGNKQKTAIYWNGKLTIEDADTKKKWASDGEIANELVSIAKDL